VRKDFENGKVRTMWQNHDLWAQPQFLDARYQPHFPAEPAESIPAGKRADGSQDDVHELHSDAGEDQSCLTGWLLHKNRGAAP
jgi:hypothetical protein